MSERERSIDEADEAKRHVADVKRAWEKERNEKRATPEMMREFARTMADSNKEEAARQKQMDALAKGKANANATNAKRKRNVKNTAAMKGMKKSTVRASHGGGGGRSDGGDSDENILEFGKDEGLASVDPGAKTWSYFAERM